MSRNPWSRVFLFVSVLLAVPILAYPQILVETPPAQPSVEGRRVPCDVEISYDDGQGDGWSLALFWVSDDIYQAVSVRFQPPGNADYLVQSAGWAAAGWPREGWIDVVAREVGNPENTTVDSIWVDSAGNPEIEFSNPICVPAGGEFYILLCPRFGVAGSVGSDSSDPDGRSYTSVETGVCEPASLLSDRDAMVWSCVTPCAPVPIREATWGQIKSMYR